MDDGSFVASKTETTLAVFSLSFFSSFCVPRCFSHLPLFHFPSIYLSPPPPCPTQLGSILINLGTVS